MGFIAQLFAPFNPRRVTSLVRTNRAPESAERQKVEQDAAADIERVEQGDQDVGTDQQPADDDELLVRCHHGGT
jgi:hypothetical protein